MSRTDPLTRIRLPDDLKARLKAAADGSRRSMNAEIRMRLEHSFGTSVVVEPTDKTLANEIESLRIEMRSGLYEAGEKWKALEERIRKLEKKREG